MADMQLKAVITAQDNASRVVQGFSKSLQGADQASKLGGLSAAGLIGTIAGGIGVYNLASTAIDKTKEFLVGSVKAFNESESAVTAMNSALKSTHGVSGMTRDGLIALSKEIQNTTSVSDEDALAIENMGLSFTNIHKDIFPQFTKATLDAATAMNNNMKPSAEQLANTTKQLGKAFQDPDTGIGALKRMGVNVDELKAKFTDSMSVQEKQKIILQELGTEFGGRATDQAKTFGGQVDQLKNKFNDFQENVGKFLVDSGMKLLETMERLGKIIYEKLKPSLDALWNTFETQLLPSLEKLWKQIGPMLMPILEKLALFLGADFIATLWAVVNVLNILAKAIGYVADVISWVVGNAKKTWNQFISDMAAVGAIVIGTINSITGWFQRLPQTIQNAVGNLGNTLYNAGRDLISGMIRGMQSAIGGVSSTITNSVGGALHTLHVPGFASGVQNFSGGMALVGERGPELVTLPGGSNVIPNDKIGGSTFNLNVNVGVYAGTDVEKRKVAQSMFDALQDIARSKNITVAEMMG